MSVITFNPKGAKEALQAGAQRFMAASPSVLAPTPALPKLIVRESVQNLLPALSKEEFSALEASILREGCRDPIVVMGDEIIDGHNRYRICVKHNIPFNLVDMCKPDCQVTVSEVEKWVINNQLMRRNLTDTKRIEYIGRLYNMEKRGVGNPGAKFAKNRPNAPENQICTSCTIDDSAKNDAAKNGSEPARVGDLVGKYLPKPIPAGKENLINSPAKKVVTAFADAAVQRDETAKSTAEKIAKEQGVSARTVHNAAKLADAIDRVSAESPVAAAKIRNEQSVLSRGEVRALADAPEEVVKEAVKAIEENKPLPSKPKPAPTPPSDDDIIDAAVLRDADLARHIYKCYINCKKSGSNNSSFVKEVARAYGTGYTGEYHTETIIHSITKDPKAGLTISVYVNGIPTEKERAAAFKVIDSDAHKAFIEKYGSDNAQRKIRFMWSDVAEHIVKLIDSGKYPPKEDKPPKSKSKPASANTLVDDSPVSTFGLGDMIDDCEHLARIMATDRVEGFDNATLEFVVSQAKLVINKLNIIKHRAVVELEKRGVKP